MPSDFPGLLTAQDRAKLSSQEMYPGQSGSDDQRDAARHMLASGYLSRSYSPQIAQALGSAHENLDITRLLERLLGKYKESPSTKMDLHNNRVGAGLAAKAGDYADFERLVNQAAEEAHGIPIEGKAYVLPSERDLLRYMDKYADGGLVTPEQLVDNLLGACSCQK